MDTMESLTSWHVETITSSELIDPFPTGLRSPSLYEIGDYKNVYEHKRPISLGSFNGDAENQSKKCQRGRRAEFAAKLLCDLEGHGTMEFEMENDFGKNWNEESLNLELFEGLSDVGFRHSPSPPSTPTSDEFENQHQLSEFSDPALAFNGSIEQSSSEFPESYNQLSAELQNIFELIPTANTDELKDVKICGIPLCQLEQGLVLFTVNTNEADEDDGTRDDDCKQSHSSNDNHNSEVEVTSHGEDDNETLFTESELVECGIEADDESQMIDIDENILDLSQKSEYEAMDENILDLSQKSEYEAGSSDEEDSVSELESTVSEEISNTILNRKCLLRPETITIPTKDVFSVRKKQDIPTSASNRIRKSKGGRKRGNSKKDNSRIKLQNRTAAARYRLKKKLESVKIKETEEKIEKENHILQLESDDLKLQIVLVKQLIRDVLHSRKLQSRRSTLKTCSK